MALHDKTAPVERLEASLGLIEEAAFDDRNFVKKGVSWALRSIGRRPPLRAAAKRLANRLAASADPAARWVGRDAARDLARR